MALVTGSHCASGNRELMMILTGRQVVQESTLEQEQILIILEPEMVSTQYLLENITKIKKRVNYAPFVQFYITVNKGLYSLAQGTPPFNHSRPQL